ncbi:HNH endonuclease, partial [Streptomyces massasporeus]
MAFAAVLAVAGCSTVDEAAPPTDTDGKPSVSASAGAGGGQGEDNGTLPGVEQARKELGGLKVAPHGSMAGYSRSKFPHWASQGESCDTRETVLERDGTDVTRDDECRAVSGKW